MNRYEIILFLLITIFAYEGCAKIGSPTGGPRDEAPPEVIATKPVNYSTGFNQKRIEIEFDEFIQLEDINHELVVSPPLEENPVVRIRKKSILVDLGDADQLREQTTYTLNFGQAIVDNNEGNLLENYEFVFSTGDYIDSLGVSGIVLNAFDLQPFEEPVYVMLYDVHYDSVPYKEIPLYIGKASEKGAFFINNIIPDTFKVFALKDVNFNYLYDLPDEYIAFMDSTIVLSAELVMAYIDSIRLLQDTLTIDSLKIDQIDAAGIDLPIDTAEADLQDTMPESFKKQYSIAFDLYMFQEDKTPQYLSDYKRVDPRRIEFYFNRPVKDTVIIEPLNFEPVDNWFILERFTMGDTLFYWIKDSIIYQQDTLKLHLNYQVTDSVMNYINYDDTLSLIYIEEVTRRRRQKDEEQEKEEFLGLSVDVRRGGKHDIYKKIEIIPDHPVASIDRSKINLFMKEDTVEYPQEFTIIADSLCVRKYFLDHSWEEGMNYRLFIDPDAFTGIYELSNDTIDIPFQIQYLDQYGKILLSIENVNQQVVIQLMSDEEQLIRKKVCNQNGLVEFPFLEPGKYKLKVLYDDNRNGKWDTGRYLEKIQPERVKYYKGSIEVRTNWDLEMKWDLENE
jgi:hypothetical protein